MRSFIKKQIQIRKKVIGALFIFSAITLVVSTQIVERMNKDTKAREASSKEFMWFTGFGMRDSYDPVLTAMLFDNLADLGADKKTLHFIPKTDGKYVADATSIYWVLGSIRKLQNVDIATFVPMTSQGAIFAHDKDHLYITGNLVEGVAWQSLHDMTSNGVGSSYVRDDKTIFYIKRTTRKSGTEASLEKIEEADILTFHLIPSIPLNVAADRAYVYMNGKKVPNLDGGTFIHKEGSSFVVDKNGTYFFSWSDKNQALSFEKISSSKDIELLSYGEVGYTRIGSEMFFGSSTLLGADATTFSVYEGEGPAQDRSLKHCTTASYCPFAKDMHTVYYFGSKISGADPKTFSLVGNESLFNNDVKQPEYAKDINHVFFKNNLIKEADPVTFKVLTTGSYRYEYGKDETTLFLQTEPIPGADVATFEVFEGQQPKEGCGIGFYAYDVTHVYHATTTIIDADLDTFTPKIGNGSYAEDKFHFYKDNTIADPEKDFEPCVYG
jgi:DKNYY family